MQECKKHGFAQGSRNLSVQKCVSEFMLVVALRDIDNLSHMTEAPDSGNPYRSDRSGFGGDTAAGLTSEAPGSQNWHRYDRSGAGGGIFY